MSVSESIVQDTVTLSSLARDHLKECDGDVEAASAALYDELDGDKYLLSIIAEQAIREAVKSYVSLAHRNDRVAIIKSIQPRVLDIAGAVKRLEKSNTRMILDFPLAGGIKLRDATKEQVQDQADMYGRTERDAAHKRVWLERIAKLLKPGQVVGKVINETKAIKLFEESSR